jgi:hypothetical protein
VSHRKDQKEELRRQREQREAAERAARQRKRLVGIGVAAAMLVAAGVVIVMAASGSTGGGGGIFPEGGTVPEQREFDLKKAVAAAGCELESAKADGVNTHTTELSEKVDYRDNPPTSGRHFQTPGQDGVYGEKGEVPQDEILVHNLEHGRVVIWAKPTLQERWRAGLRAMMDKEDFQTVLVPRADMPYAVAATAWNRDPLPQGTGRTLGCDEFNPRVYDALQAFRDEHRSNGPEPVD